MGLSLAYDEEQKLVGWTRMETKGYFEDVASLPRGGPFNEDSVYFIVKRYLNGRTVRNIEVMRERFFDDVRDAFYVDCGLSYDVPYAITGITSTNPVVITAPGHAISVGDTIEVEGVEWYWYYDSDGNKVIPSDLNLYQYTVTAVSGHDITIDVDGSGFSRYSENGNVRKCVTTVSGLEHLEGEAVSVLADGNVVNNMTVVNGSLTLPNKSARVHAGLGYVCDVKTLPLLGANNGALGVKKGLYSVDLALFRSKGVSVGPSIADLVEMKQRDEERYGEATELFSDIKRILLYSDWNEDGSIYIRQKYPLPMTLLYILPHFETGDDI
jgi:hypothetical protein